MTTQILMKATGGREKFMSAPEVLEYINGNEMTASLVHMNWSSDQGKIDFLTGKTKAFLAEVALPLSQEEAEKALSEYKVAMGIK